MSKSKAEELSKRLYPNLVELADQIARKPIEHNSNWATTIVDAFSLYTRTNTVNQLVASGESFREVNWPFPAFMDIEREIRHIQRDFWWLTIPILGRVIGWRSFTIAICRLNPSTNNQVFVDWLMCRRFNQVSQQIFRYWYNHPLLSVKKKHLNDIFATYRHSLWHACVPALLPQLDFLIRTFLKTEKLTIGVGNVADAFKIAGFTYESLIPGYGVCKASSCGHNHTATSIERDLRLPGIFLASWAEFASKFYAEHKVSCSPTTNYINRHAILHGDVTEWTKADAIKLLIFFDLTLRLEPVLTRLLHPRD